MADSLRDTHLDNEIAARQQLNRDLREGANGFQLESDYLTLGRALKDESKCLQATKYYEKASLSSEDPLQKDICREEMAICLSKAMQYDKAEPLFKEHLRFEESRYQHAKSEFHLESGLLNVASARSEYAHCLLEPKDLQRNSQGLEELKKCRREFARYDGGEAKPDTVRLILEIARIEYKSGDKQGAVRDHERAEQLIQELGDKGVELDYNGENRSGLF